MFHLDEQLLVRYLSDEASDDECLHVDRHLAGCDQCVKRLRALAHLRANFDSIWERWSEAEHVRLISSEQVAESGRVRQRSAPASGLESLAVAIRRIFGQLQLARSPLGLGLLCVAASGLMIWWFLPRTPLVEIRIADRKGSVSLTPDNEILAAWNSSLSPPWRAQVGRLLRLGRVEQTEAIRTAVSEIRSSQALLSPLPRETNAPAAIAPVGTMLKTAQPHFRWSAVPGAQAYKVVIADGNPPLWEWEAGSRTELVVRTNIPVLRPGQIYTWQVESTVDGLPRLSWPAKFGILESRALAEVQQLEQTFRDSAVALAALYQAYGLYDHAREQIEELERLNPNSPVVRRMSEALRSSP